MYDYSLLDISVENQIATMELRRLPREMRGGKMNDPNFKTRMRGEGVFGDNLKQMFMLACRKTGLNAERPQLNAAAFRRPGEQRLLFG